MDTNQYFFLVIIMVYIWGEYFMSRDQAEVIYSKYGILITILFMTPIVIYTQPPLWGVGLIVVHILVQKAISIVGINYISEEEKWSSYEEQNTHPQTVEQKVIEERVPSNYVPIYAQR
jgi:hypothetical protein